MKTLLAVLLLAAMAAAQDKPKAPTITADQKAELADALTNAIQAESELERLPGYADATAKVRTASNLLMGIQQTVCKSTDGKKYQVNRSVDPSGKTEWSCKEVSEPAKK